MLNFGPVGVTQVASPVMQEIRWNMLGAKRNAAQLRVLSDKPEGITLAIHARKMATVCLMNGGKAPYEMNLMLANSEKTLIY